MFRQPQSLSVLPERPAQCDARETGHEADQPGMGDGEVGGGDSPARVATHREDEAKHARKTDAGRDPS